MKRCCASYRRRSSVRRPSREGDLLAAALRRRSRPWRRRRRKFPTASKRRPRVDSGRRSAPATRGAVLRSIRGNRPAPPSSTSPCRCFRARLVSVSRTRNVDRADRAGTKTHLRDDFGKQRPVLQDSDLTVRRSTRS